MAYTRPWSNLIPSPNRVGDEADDALRELRLDIEERMDDVLDSVGSWTSDPIVDTTTYYEFLHWSVFREVASNWIYGSMAGSAAGDWTSTLFTQGLRHNGSATVTVYAPIELPADATLVDVDLSAVTQLSTSFAATVYVVDASTSTVSRTSLANRTIAASTAQGNFSLSSGAGINHALDHTKDEFLFVEIVMTNSNVGAASFGFQGLRVTYTRHPFRYV